VSYLFFWRAKTLRRKEIREVLGTLPSVGMLYVNLFFGVQRKTLCVFASLRANFFFFSPRRKAAKNLGKLLAPFLLCVILFISYRVIAAPS
jgi:hypothetical protein